MQDGFTGGPRLFLHFQQTFRELILARKAGSAVSVDHYDQTCAGVAAAARSHLLRIPFPNLLLA